MSLGLNTKYSMSSSPLMVREELFLPPQHMLIFSLGATPNLGREEWRGPIRTSVEMKRGLSTRRSREGITRISRILPLASYSPPRNFLFPLPFPDLPPLTRTGKTVSGVFTDHVSIIRGITTERWCTELQREGYYLASDYIKSHGEIFIYSKNSPFPAAPSQLKIFPTNVLGFFK